MEWVLGVRFTHSFIVTKRGADPRKRTYWVVSHGIENNHRHISLMLVLKSRLVNDIN